MKLKTVSKWLVILGAWEVGLMYVGFDLIGSVFGGWPMIVKLIYILVLVSAVWGTWAMLMKKK